MLTYLQRAELCKNPTAKKLLTLMEEKQTNLSLSLDVTRKSELLDLARMLGPYICVLKTHIDILEDFDQDTITQLQTIAEQFNFLIFEDRKFADIGNTVTLQYEKGIYRIADWAHITNAHTIPGPGIIEGLKKIGLAKGHGLLLLAQMSSKGTLITKEYTQKTVAMAEEHKDFVIGFITQQKLSNNETFINFTPGVQFNNANDNLGQQYITPEKAILDNHTDIIIVGRGIYKSNELISEAEKYQLAGWRAYQQLLSN